MLQHCNIDFSCKCQDAANNTFACVRRVAKHYNSVFCLFQEDEVIYNMFIQNNLNK